MLLIGERINSTRSSVQKAIRSRNAPFLVREAASQIEAGANFIDINCAVTMGNELEDIDWAVSVIQSSIKDVNISVDSPNYLAIEKGLSVYKASGGLFINSITGEESRMANILPLAKKYKTKVIALTMDERGMPQSASDRANVAKKILDCARRDQFNEEDLYFDPLIQPISTEPKQAGIVLESISLIKALGKVKTICGLSNVSFGLPNRSLINSIFLAMAIQKGLDGAILDPTDKNIASSISAAKALLDRDEYCASYLEAFRAGKLT